MKYCKVTLSLLALVVFVISCGSPESSFEKAKSKNTIEAYQKFIDKYPDSPMVAEAEESMNKMAPHIVVSVKRAGGIMGDALSGQAYNFIFFTLRHSGRKLTFIDEDDVKKIANQIPGKYIWLHASADFYGSFQTELSGVITFFTPGSLCSWSNRQAIMTGSRMNRDEFFNYEKNPFLVQSKLDTVVFDDEMIESLNISKVSDVEEVKLMDPL